MSAKATLFTGKVKALDRAAVRALEKTTEALYTEIVQAQVIPFQSGHLQDDSTFADTSGASKGYTEIVSSTPYARRLYFHPEYHFNKEENPNARGKWFADWMAGGKKKDFAPKAFAKLYKQESGI